MRGPPQFPHPRPEGHVAFEWGGGLGEHADIVDDPLGPQGRGFGEGLFSEAEAAMGVVESQSEAGDPDQVEGAGPGRVRRMQVIGGVQPVFGLAGEAGVTRFRQPGL